MRKNIVIIFVIIFFSCKGISQNNLKISEKPVFYEIDSSKQKKEDKPFSRHDYFLVSGDLENKTFLKNIIDSFAKKYYSKECGKYANYIMFFYKESPEVNENAVKKEKPEYRYKIFTYYKETNFIGSYYCRNGYPSSRIDIEGKYE